MDILENLVMMKRLLRQGWVRAGVPVGSIESLAAHSWSVAFLALFFCLEENQKRTKKQLNLEKTVLISLLHDFHESEWLDMDKSVSRILSPKQFESIQLALHEGAVNSLLSKFPSSIRGTLEEILLDTESEEYHLARVADLMDLIIQADAYGKKQFLNHEQVHEFGAYAREELEHYKPKFGFLKPLIEKWGI
ncbi:MAG: YfbR-like 5'-deoxynucleotidase [Candidatus Heimdallarchaeota archaeon]